MILFFLVVLFRSLASSMLSTVKLVVFGWYAVRSPGLRCPSWEWFAQTSSRNLAEVEHLLLSIAVKCFPIDLNHIMNQIFSDWIVRWWNFVNFNTKETLMLNWMGNWLVNEWLWMLLGCWYQPQKDVVGRISSHFHRQVDGITSLNDSYGSDWSINRQVKSSDEWWTAQQPFW